MDALCQPLKQHLKIDYIGYLRDEVDCKTSTQTATTVLTNNPALLDFLLFSYSHCEDNDNCNITYNSSGKYYLEASMAPKWAAAVSNHCQVHHCLTKHIKIGENLWERFTFGSSSPDIKQLNTYLNNCALLDKFIVYFRDRAAKLINAAWQTRFIIKHPQTSHTFLLHDESYHAQARDQFLESIEPQHYSLQNKQHYAVLVPKSEMRCLTFLGQGRSAKEIASLLNISPRTVETYWQRSKIRLDCYTRKELLDILAMNRGLF